MQRNPLDTVLRYSIARCTPYVRCVQKRWPIVKTMASAKHARASSPERPDDNKRTKLEDGRQRLPYNESTYTPGKLFHPGDFNPHRKDGKLPIHQLEEALAELDERVDLRQSKDHNVLFLSLIHI